MFLKKNYEFISEKLPKIGSKEDSKRLRDGITKSLTLANKGMIESQPLMEKLKKFKVSKNLDIKETTFKLMEKYNFFEGALKKLNILARNLFEEDVPVGNVEIFDEHSPLVSQEDVSNNHNLLKKQQAFLQLENERDFQDAIIHQRDDEIKAIQQQMRDVNIIYKDIAGLVQMQGEMVDNIMLNISGAERNVKVAVDDVSLAQKHHNKSRGKLCFLAICITVVVAVAVVVVLVLFTQKKE